MVNSRMSKAAALFACVFLLLFGMAWRGRAQESASPPAGEKQGDPAVGQEPTKPKADRPPISIRLFPEEKKEREPGKPILYGGWGGPVATYLVLDLSALDPMTRDRGLPGFDEQMVMAGGMGGVTYYPPGENGFWYFGAMGFGVNQSESDLVSGPDRNAKLSLAGGGLFAEYHFAAGSRLDLILGAMLGAGSLTLSARGDDLLMVSTDKWSANQSFALGYPYAGVGYQALPWMRLEATAGYLLMNAGLDGANFRAPDSHLRMTDGAVTGGPQYMIRIIFGWRPAKK